MQIGLTFLVPAYQVVLERRPLYGSPSYIELDTTQSVVSVFRGPPTSKFVQIPQVAVEACGGMNCPNPPMVLPLYTNQA